MTSHIDHTMKIEKKENLNNRKRETKFEFTFSIFFFSFKTICVCVSIWLISYFDWLMQCDVMLHHLQHHPNQPNQFWKNSKQEMKLSIYFDLLFVNHHSCLWDVQQIKKFIYLCTFDHYHHPHHFLKLNFVFTN